MLTSLLCGVVLLQSAAAAAELPGSVRDLPGARAAGGESTLETRGFSIASSSTLNGRKINYWWNGNTKECIRVATYDGHFEDVTVASHADCKQRSGNGAATAAAVILGTAAVVGAVAQSQKHDHNRYDHQVSSQYRRGYDDGINRRGYNNYNNSSAYEDGFAEGRRARRGNDDGDYGPYGNFGDYPHGTYNTQDNFREMEGRDRDYVMSRLAQRGFVVRDTKNTGNGHYTTMWRHSPRQCIIVGSRHGTVNSIQRTSEQTCRD